MIWLFTAALFAVGCNSDNDIFVITSGLYAIAGAIWYARR